MASVCLAGHETPRMCDVHLRNLPLKKGERIESIIATVHVAQVRGVAIPADWGMSVSIPDLYEGTIVSGQAGHGASWVDSGEELGAFVTLGFLDDVERKEFKKETDVSITLITWSNAGEVCRTSTVPASCIVVLDHPDNIPTNKQAAVVPAPVVEKTAAP